MNPRDIAGERKKTQKTKKKTFSIVLYLDTCELIFLFKFGIVLDKTRLYSLIPV